MKSFVRSLLLLACLAAIVSTTQAAREEIRKGSVVVIPLKGEVSPPMFLFLRRILKAAESANASAIILEMNTYGGRLDSAEKITNLLNRASIPTYTFINTNAGSAGALIALATQHIYMAPVSAIGAAAPIKSTGEDLGMTARDKTISYWSALVRGSANRNRHNPDVGEAFMDKEKEVKINDRLIHAKGTLLTLSAQEAAMRINGKPVLAEGIAELHCRGRAKGRPQGRGRRGAAGRIRAPRLLDHRPRTAPPAWGHDLRLSRIQNPRRGRARHSGGGLLWFVFSRPLFRRPRGLGSGGALRRRRRPRSGGDFHLRPQHHPPRRPRRFSDARSACSGRWWIVSPVNVGCPPARC